MNEKEIAEQIKAFRDEVGGSIRIEAYLSLEGQPVGIRLYPHGLIDIRAPRIVANADTLEQALVDLKSLYNRRKDDFERALIYKMAARIIELADRNGEVSAADLGRSFAITDIVKHIDAAEAEANKDMVSREPYKVVDLDDYIDKMTRIYAVGHDQQEDQ